MTHSGGPFLRAVLGVALLAAALPAHAADYYIAPEGSATGKGTKEAPWDIASALAGKQPVGPGDTVYLREGTYRRRPREQFDVKLAGAEGQPIHVRPAPGERARIDGGLAVLDPSAHLWIWELELFVSEPQPDKPVSAGPHPKEFTRPWGGLNGHGGSHCKFINLVIHDTRQGVSWWVGSRDSELHGCLIYDNGWQGADKGWGHAIYTQNNEGLKIISDCILTGGYAYTMHAYGSERAYVNNYVMEGNICYDAHASFLVGGGRPSKHIRVVKNYLYGLPMRIGYSAPYNEDCELRDNLIVNGGLTINKYKQVVNEGNVLLPKGAARPSGSRVVFRPNKYDPDRANVAVFNWDRAATVAVKPGDFLKKGDSFRLLNPRDFYGKPVLTGTYDGESIKVPMAGEFVALVLLKGSD